MIDHGQVNKIFFLRNGQYERDLIPLSIHSRKITNLIRNRSGVVPVYSWSK